MQPTPIRKRFVLFFCRVKTYVAFEKLAGLVAAGRAHRQTVRFLHRGLLSRPIEDYLACWNPVGVVSDDANFRTPPGNRSCPTVFLDVEAARLRTSDTLVQFDSESAGRLAAEEFLRLGLTSFAFIGSFTPRYWSDERERGFRDALAAAGAAVNVYPGNRSQEDSVAIQDEIRTWVRSLSKPCGVFAATDEVAEWVLGTCQHLGVRVPEEVAVIGVDNDESVCENTYPSLTSVAPDFRMAGRLTAEALEERLRTGRAPSAHFGSARLVRRESTRIMHRSDVPVRRVLELIDREACRGLRARDALLLMNCPRRTAEARFRAATGMSPLEAINKIRFERVVQLLRKPEVSLGEIAEMAAFSSEAQLRQFFKRRTGSSLRAWRKIDMARKR